MSSISNKSMKTTYTAILINAKDRIIDEIQCTDYKDIQKLIDCGCFTTGHSFNNNDTLYVDDEGLINGTTHGFYFNGRLLAGNGLVCGANDEGENADVKHRIGQIENMVQFLPYGNELNATMMEQSAKLYFIA